MPFINNNYKKSKFNIFTKYKDNEIIIFNTLSGSIGKFNQDTYNRYIENSLTEAEINVLLKKGILISYDFDEKKKIDNDRYVGIKDSSLKHFRIWTTSACNARCYYCFEKGIEPIMMSSHVADNVIDFISKTLQKGDTLKIEWFGGEPLLNSQIIDYIYFKLKGICLEKKCITHNTIISNGSLISQELATKLKKDWDIELIQITLDGFDGDYNSIKNYYEPSKHNFYNVINSIKYLANEGIHVTIRMNYDTHNYSSLVELINYLHNELKDYSNISYYVYPVWSSIDEQVEGSFCSTTEADLNLLNLFDLLIRNKMGTARKIARLNYKKQACQAWSENSLTILPDGKITKCCESYNQIIGDVWRGITNKELFDYWVDYRLDNKCCDCVYLPLCQGGCKSSHFSRMPQCFALKPIINEFLVWYVSYLDAECK